MRPLVYIAGPYTQPDPVLNTRRAVKLAERVEASGAIAVVPHLTMLWHLVSPHPIEFWYDHDLAMLAHCHALIRFGGASRGADREVEFAERHSIPVFSESDPLGFWPQFLEWENQWRP